MRSLVFELNVESYRRRHVPVGGACRYPFFDGEHQHSAWCDVGDFHDSLMAGIGGLLWL